jgi:iron(III) transport system permease protein
MISPAALERPGHWRTIGVVAGVLIASSPTLPLLRLAVGDLSGFDIGTNFDAYLARSITVGIGACALALVLGFPCGLLAGLYRFPARNVLLTLLAVPLLVPSFLWAIGLSMLRIELGLSQESLLSGASGTVMAFATLGTGLVLFATLLATRALPARAIDAARLAGGELNVLTYAGRATLPAAAAACLLAGLISLADPGPGQILGYSGAGTQILISFSALYDFELAARQSLTIAGIALFGALPLLWIVGHHLSFALLPQSVELMKARSLPAVNGAGPLLLGLVLIVCLALPIAGLVWPAFTQLWLDRILEVTARTASNTLFYGVTAGIVANAVAMPVVICATRVPRLRLALLVALLLLFVLPPAVGALGSVLAASDAPAWLDPLVRSRLTVAVVLGLRLTPIAAVVLLRAIGTAPPSWAFAAAVHGVGLMTYLRKLLVPFLARPLAVSLALVALVATADITTVLLLQPPGQDSFPVALFTVMANAPESMVASLSLAYVLAGGLAAGALAVWLNNRRDGPAPQPIRLVLDY